MGKLICFGGGKSDASSADDVLERSKGELDDVVVIGFDKHGRGHLDSSYASDADTAFVLLQMLIYVASGSDGE